MKLWFVLLIVLAGLISNEMRASDSDSILQALSGVNTVEVSRTDTYWDGGSIGVSLKGDNGIAFEIRAINPKIKPARRFFLFSITGWEKAISIEEVSLPEKRIVELLTASHSDDARGNKIIHHLRSMIQDRTTPWDGFDWHTIDYLKEQFKRTESKPTQKQ